MSATVAANARTLVHAGSGGLSLAFPDVCRTPAALGAPLPYPNLARSADAAKTARRTSADGKPVCLERSELRCSTGDEPGSGGGVVSGTFRGAAHPVAGSRDVRIEGDGAMRAFDLWLHNRRNTPPFPIVQPPLPALAGDADPRCLLCGRAIDPLDPGKHLAPGTLAEVHDAAVRQADSGGACLWAHRAGSDATSCCHRRNAARAARNGTMAAYGALGDDAFARRDRPFWHDIHHVIAPRLLHEALDEAAGDDADLARLALLRAGLNLNLAWNLLILPLQPGDARRLALPRRLVVDAATIGVPPAIAGAWAGKDLYAMLIAWLLKPVATALAATLRAPDACAAPGPAPGAVARTAIETLAGTIRGAITAPNRALAALPR
jgi:hypothetical protein